MTASTRLRVQTLEDRTVPAYVQPLPFGITLGATGTLNVIGNEHEQRATVWVEGDQVKASMMTIKYITQQGTPVPLATTIQKTYNSAQVQRIVFHGKAAGDDFTNDTALPSSAFGGDGDDFLVGGSGADYLNGGTGTDFLEGRGGDDHLRGSTGGDYYLFNTGALGTDTISEDPEEDHDWLDFSGLSTGITVNLGTTAVQTVIPNNLSLKLSSWLGIERVEGSDRADVITGNLLANTLNGNDGNDSLLGVAGSDVISGGNGHDTLRGGSGNDGLSGNAGNDDLYGDAGNDVLVPFTGDNFVSDGSGNDRVDFTGNSQGVTFTTGGGNDTVIGSAYADDLTGSTGNDRLDGGLGNDTLAGGAGNDTLSGSNGDDRLAGQAGQDSLDGAAGDDRLDGGSDNDRLTGGLDADTLLGGTGNDSLAGGSGDDSLDGGIGRDTMDGGADDDELFASRGDETLKNGERVEITVPTGSPQTDAWSCGPNSGSRLLRSYGLDVSYTKLRADARDSNIISQFGLGTPPPSLRTIMQKYRSGTQLKSGATFATLLARLGEGRPVVALIGWGEIYVPNPLSPLDLAPEKLHYICLTGFDRATDTLFYTDTNGAEKTMGFSEFQNKWDWPAGPTTYLWMSALGIKRNTMIW